jgi:ribosomal protein S18 acetylase RimI-like enzyme
LKFLFLVDGFLQRDVMCGADIGADKREIDPAKDKVALRAAALADAPRLAVLHQERHGSDLNVTIARIETHLAEIANGLQFAVCVAEVDGVLVGYGMVGHRNMTALGARNMPDGLYLAGVYTSPAYRRCGIGHRLTRYRIQWAQGHADRLYYYSHIDNHASMALHQGRGFREVGRDFEVPPGTPGPVDHQVLFEKRFP